ncbi:hypothetical protein M2280_004113 [Prescottella agglutinans]|uniref:Uncharacterized protein n=1 Tax=Prescottella agglutinans TaxID=1644129 RepID=A0ABT6MGF1_9NOCA|nr:hypothetical protein [Prescottella agglutinans]
MPNKRIKKAHYNPYFSCLGKRQHESQSAAEYVARAMNRNSPRTLSVNSYHCPNCSKWHVGHKKPARTTPRRHDPALQRSRR